VTAKKLAAKTEWTLTDRDYVEATVFGDTTKTYVTGLGREYPPARWTPTEGEFNELHITAPRKGAVPQAIFLDYVMLKGVENVTVDLLPGQPARLHIDMIIGKVTYVEDDPSTE
jgi:hypothetical protein